MTTWAEHGIGLRRSPDRAEAVDALAERLGGRVGLEGVLADLDRTAHPGRVRVGPGWWPRWLPGLAWPPPPAPDWGFRWDERDQTDRRWWPQGITTSADHGDDGVFAGREVVLTSAYARKVDGVRQGARITVVDVTGRTTVRYRHVLLVAPVLDDTGRLRLHPVRVHAGGLVWHGPHLHVASTARGLTCFRLDDIVPVPAGGDPGRLGLRDYEVDAFGYRYLLPVRFSYDAGTSPGTEPLRYSFLSLARGGAAPELVAGEYARTGMTRRLVSYEVDPATALLRADDDGFSTPRFLSHDGTAHMQGAVTVDDRWYVTTSHGPRPGSLWTGHPGGLRRHRWALPPGPEDVAYQRATDRLWSLSEHPGRRYVFTVPRSAFD